MTLSVPNLQTIAASTAIYQKIFESAEAVVNASDDLVKAVEANPALSRTVALQEFDDLKNAIATFNRENAKI